MATKRTTVTKGKPSGFTAPIRALESCLAADQAKLKSVYPKVLSDVDRAIARTAEELKKAKAKARPARAGKSVARPVKARTVALVSLERALNALKGEKTSIQLGLKKFVAQQKAHQQFEKIWVKNSAKLVRHSSNQRSKKKVVRRASAGFGVSRAIYI